MNLKTTAISLAALAAACAFAPGAASAMPNGLPHPEGVSNIDQVRWVCDPWGRCGWRPNFYGAYGFYDRPRFFHRPFGFGWHRGWRRW